MNELTELITDVFAWYSMRDMHQPNTCAFKGWTRRITVDVEEIHMLILGGC